MSKKDGEPVNYRDFTSFKVSIESRLTAVETEQKWIKENLNSLRKQIESLSEKMDESNKTILSKVDELKSVILTMPRGGNRIMTGLGVGGIMTGIIAIIILILKAILQVI